MSLKTLAQGLGAAILFLILRIWPHLSSYHPVIYHSFLPLRSVVWGVLIDLAVVTLLAAWLFWYLEQSEKGLRTAIWAFVAAELVSASVTAGAGLRRSPLPYLNPDVAYLVTLLGALLLRWLRPADYRRAVRGLTILLALAGCTLIWMVPELLYQGLRAQRIDVRVPVLEPAPPSSASAANPTGHQRIVWLLFDELSYDQTFDHRFPGLTMPAFDALKSRSLVYSDLRPAGYYTDRVVPSLFLGKRIENIRSNLDGEPMMQLAGSHRWQAFNAGKTLFSDAQRLGWTTGIAGWYNPYCRILAGTLNYCFWRMGDGQSDGALPDHSAFENALTPVAEVLRRLEHRPGLNQEKHEQDLAVLMPQAEALIRDQGIDFVFIHLPVPHPPGIYDRRTGRHRASGSYIDNLALADKSLAELMHVFEQTPDAARTTLIVCSDHSWRVPMWRSTTLWTREDELASKGHFDPRPVLMIHYPGQQVEQDVTKPFDLICVHDTIERLLRGQAPSP